jgi:hypothetical protein
LQDERPGIMPVFLESPVEGVAGAKWVEDGTLRGSRIVKWSCLCLQIVCALLATAMVHSDNRLTSAITMGIFATGVAASVLLIAAHDRPFIGQISVGPEPLLQTMPEAEGQQTTPPREP